MKIKHFLMYIIALIIFPIIMSPVTAGVTFNREFAPQEGLTASIEKPYRDEVCLNGLWKFQPMPLPANYSLINGTPPLGIPDPAAWEKTPIRIPSPWNVNSFSESDGGDFKCFPSYPTSWEKVDMGWLKKTFKVPASWKGKRILLHFEAIAGDAEIVVNGISTAQQFDIFMPLTIDITQLVNWSGVNTLLVGIRKPALFDIPGKMGRWTYPTGSFWGMHIAGIWQDVYLQAEPMVRVDNVFVKPLVDKDTLSFDLKLRNDTAKTMKVSIKGTISQWMALTGRDVLSAPEVGWRLDSKPALTISARTVDLKPGVDINAALSSAVKGKLALWTPDSPRLYGAVIDISASGKVIDRKYVRFGWRQFGIKGKSLMLNGKPIQAKGDAWHFMGVPQMTRRYAWSWYKAIKDANGNAVRPHAQAYPRFYLDVADEMGIMVLDETAIWASHCGFNYEESVTWDRFRSHADALVMRDRNHPSVFGWSVENEVNAALGVTKVTPEEFKEIDDKIIEIVKRMEALDPTRPWISADGDEDMGGRLNAAVGHYGDLDYYERLAKLKIPYGIGEACCAYYGTPKEVSQFNGDRAYESFLGRIEGVAIDAYNLLIGQRKSAAYCSVFNLAWYGLKPLSIGLKDTGLAPKLTDGIIFGKYTDGKPGMQPERLGPYSTTFNPGYDPQLPLYDPWPLFDAIKAAYAPKPLPSPWDHKRVDPPPTMPMPAATIESVGFIGDPSGKLSFSLIRAGVAFEKDVTEETRLLIIDGNTIPEGDYKRAMTLANSVAARGGTVMVWGLDKKSLPEMNRILPAPVTLTDRTAVSLVPKEKSLLTANMRMSDLYFADQPFGSVVLPQGLDGQFVKDGNVILEACNTDWRRWNDRSENIKTASVLRSERETKPSSAALVELAKGKGRYLVCTIDLSVSTPKHMQLVRRLLGNLGVKLSEPVAMQGGVFDASGSLKQALVIGGFAVESIKAAYDNDLLGGETSAAMKPKSGDKVGDLSWQIKDVDDGVIMDFKRNGLPGASENCAAYISFWLFSPRPLDQLLAQPDVPKVDLIAGADDGVKIWLNGGLLIQDYGVHPLVPDQYKCLSMPLKQGWNHFLIKVVQGWGEWQFAARLQCSDPRFLASMRTSADAPAE
ncbi:MAG: glycoside hydrolase family 2 protein [Armatimonadota bacterium]